MCVVKQPCCSVLDVKSVRGSMGCRQCSTAVGGAEPPACPVAGFAPCALACDIHEVLIKGQVLRKACSQTTCWCRVIRRLLSPALMMAQRAAHPAQRTPEVIPKPTGICLPQVRRSGSITNARACQIIWIGNERSVMPCSRLPANICKHSSALFASKATATVEGLIPRGETDADQSFLSSSRCPTCCGVGSSQ